MNVSRLVPLFLAAPFLFSAPAYAQVKAGDTEVGVFGIISSDNEAETSSLTMGGSIGHFFTDNLELKGNMSINTTTDAADNSTGYMSFGGGGDLALGGAENKFVPYVGASLQLVALFLPNDVTGSGVTLDIHAGMKFFITERSSLDLSLHQNNGTATIDYPGGSIDADIDRTEFLLGINVYI